MTNQELQQFKLLLILLTTLQKLVGMLRET